MSSRQIYEHIQDGGWFAIKNHTGQHTPIIAQWQRAALQSERSLVWIPLGLQNVKYMQYDQIKTNLCAPWRVGKTSVLVCNGLTCQLQWLVRCITWTGCFDLRTWLEYTWDVCNWGYQCDLLDPWVGMANRIILTPTALSKCLPLVSGFWISWFFWQNIQKPLDPARVVCQYVLTA